MIQSVVNEQLCFAVYRAQKELNRMYTVALEPYRLTYTQYLLLLVLWEKDQQSVSEIGKVLSLDSGTLTPMIKRMEQNGYLTRKRSQIDERIVVIQLTSQAKESKEAILATVQSCLTIVTEDEENYFDLLHQINQLAEKVGGIINEKSL
ncbi:MarR family winged helix-turn-helix transcriptional regulator [Enterococcus sp. LJL98]